jgi:hypothetical protein
MPVQLRGHHFLCILTYRGYGYTPAFVENMTDIVAAIGRGRPVRLVSGPDAICGGLTAEDRHACNHDCGKAETMELDRLAVEEVGDLLGLDLSGRIEIDQSMVARLREAFAARSVRSACRRCPWSDFCTEIAAESFAGTKLFPPDA